MACGPGCECDCCAGIDIETPMRLFNAPGLEQINYRMGRHGPHFETLKAQLSSADFPALAALTTRSGDDAAIALCDALAVNLDVVSFYAERFANEHFLRTATERLSVIEMARLIGYRPAPGVAAGTHMAFTLQDLPGVETGPVKIPVGTRIQSVPGQDETAQTFETGQEVLAHVSWNAIPALASRRWVPTGGDQELWLAGVATQLEPGDAILIVGAERISETDSPRWQVRVLSEVTADTDNDRTRVAWTTPLQSASNLPQRAAEVHVFRKRASLFGHNAPDPNLFSEAEGSNINHVIHTPSSGNWTWRNFSVGSTIDIDPQDKKIVADSWVALVSNQPGSGMPDLPGFVDLYRANEATQRSRQAFGLSSKITRITPDTTDNLVSSRHRLRRSLVLCQSEVLPVARPPIRYPAYGDDLTLAARLPEFVPGQALALSGKRQAVRIAPGVTDLELSHEDGSVMDLTEGDRLFMTAPAVLVWYWDISLTAAEFDSVLGSGYLLQLDVIDRDGTPGRLIAQGYEFDLVPSEDDDETVREIAFIGDDPEDIEIGRDTTMLTLSETMTHIYERASLRVNANVAPATQGETVEEILGGGGSGKANQQIMLAQSPLTYISAPTASGRASTLELRVDDVLWQEQPSLYGAAADAHVFETLQTDEGATIVQFGDGEEAARVATGATNIRAKYRKGLGVGGNVEDGKITTLLSRPLGVSEAVNPVPATGGEDPEPLNRARQNAPLTVLTLDRAVSISDYANFSRAFAGIDKAHALWIPSGPARGVFVTIGGVDGAEVPDTSDTYTNLSNALRDYGDPLVPIRLANFADSRFRLKAAVKVDPAYEPGLVLDNVRAALRSAFSYEARAFGQTVSVDEVAAVAHDVAGVTAIHVIHLHRAGAFATLQPRIFATLPVATLDTLPDPAELLTLTDDPIELDVMP